MSTIADVTTMLTDVLTWILASMGKVLTFIIANPLFLVGFAIAVGFKIVFKTRRLF